MFIFIEIVVIFMCVFVCFGNYSMEKVLNYANRTVIYVNLRTTVDTKVNCML